MAKKVSIYDIAKHIGVSPATVSYVINGKKKISEATKKKVMQAIEEIGYEPDYTARTLSTGKSHLLGLCIPLNDASIAFMQNPFYVEFLTGLELGIANKDYDIVIGCTENLNNFKSWAKSRKLDGVIMIGSYPKQVYEGIKALNIPIVLIDVYEESAKEFHNIRVNDEEATYQATKYLIDNGHTKIGFAGDMKNSLVDYHRFLGYKKALEDHKIELLEERLYSGYATFEEGRKIATEILKKNNITGLVTSSDVLAIGIMRKYFEEKKTIPDDLSIIGFDDIQDAKYVFPSLTTMRQNTRLKGQLAAQVILDNISSEESQESMVELDAKLIVRESVKKI